MAFTPDSVIHLCNVPFESDYKHQITFDTIGQQEQYFMNRRVRTVNNCTYVRKEGYIRLPYHIDSLWNCNYVMYLNNNFTNKWFYAFITRLEYVNDGVTNAYIETDVWQTWQFDITLRPSFVEREHVTDDSIGANTLDEGLAYGDYIVNAIDTPIERTADDLCYIIGCTVNPVTSSDTVGGKVYNGIYSGVTYYKADGKDAINTVIKNIEEAGKIDSITGIFMAPKDISLGESYAAIVGLEKVNEGTNPSTKFFSVNKNFDMNGYTPKNNKLKVFPYNFLRVSNNAGQSAIYPYEYFSTEQCNFYLYETIAPGISGRLIPTNYKKEGQNYDEGLSEGKYPVCNFAVDMYTNWQTQNAVNQGFDLLMGVGTMAVGAAAALTTPVTAGVGGIAGAGMMVSGFNQIVNTLNNDRKASLVPDQVRGNTNCGDVNTSMGRNCFDFYKVSIKQEYAKIIDDFFEMYGYKVNRVKVPNIKTRPCWNYVKTVNMNLDGKAPQQDLEKIKDLFNNGITFWRSSATLEDYSQNNH